MHEFFDYYCKGDAERGDKIYKGKPAVNAQVENAKPTKDNEGSRESQSNPSSSARKEKSVLQAKLTKLAIQIGYAGNYM